jgi:EAL domain-containing protein (putative c-di-GMP-specific phosphodiesterase class I)
VGHEGIPDELYFLETLLEDGVRIRRIVVRPLPFRVGRLPGADLMLPFDSVSKAHAELYHDGENLRLRDLGSTNGTFVNRMRVEDVAVLGGDIVHFAEFEFRLGAQSLDSGSQDVADKPDTLPWRERRPERLHPESAEIRELIRSEAVAPLYQPIVTLPSAEWAGLELLGCGRFPGLPEAPADLLRLAATAGAERELAALFRRVAVGAIAGRRALPPLFLNTHLRELGEPGLVASIAELQAQVPAVKIYVEIHEGALADPAQVAALRAELDQLGMGVAYGGFGAGQARLIELAEVPPHFLKFDHRFVHGIDRAQPSRRRLLASLVTLAKELGAQTVAEGVETLGEAETCAEIGFTHAQGSYFGEPLDPDALPDAG